MKLRINRFLRTALLSCYAAAVTLTTSISAGTLAIGSVAFGLISSTQEVEAAESDIFLKEESSFGVMSQIDIKSLISNNYASLNFSPLNDTLTHVGSGDPDNPSEFNWNTTDKSFNGGSMAFTQGASVSFTRYTTATLTESISAGNIHVSEYSYLTLAASEGILLSADGVTLEDHGIISIMVDMIDTSHGVLGVEGTVYSFISLDSGDFNLSSILDLSNFKGGVSISNSTATITSASLGGSSMLDLYKTTATFALDRDEQGGVSSSFNFRLHDAALHFSNIEAGETASMYSLFVHGTSTMTLVNGATFSFMTLLGEGVLNLTSETSASEGATLEIHEMRSFNGTLNFAQASLYLTGDIWQEEESHFAINGRAVTVENVTISGGGSISFNDGVTLIGHNVVEGGTLSMSSLQQSSIDNTLTILAGSLNFTGARIDSVNKALIHIGEAVIQSSEASTTIAENFVLGAHDEDAGNVRSVTTTINTDQSDGGGGAALTISGNISSQMGIDSILNIIGSGSVKLSGNNSITEVTINDGATFITGSSTAAESSTIYVEGGSLDVDGQELDTFISFQAGSISGLARFQGYLHITSDLELHDAFSGSISVDGGAKLSLRGPWRFKHMIDNRGDIVFSTSMILDLTDAEFDDQNKLRLVLDGSKLDDSAWLSNSSTLDTSKVIGLIPEWYSYSYADGVVTSIFKGNIHTVADSTLDLAIGTMMPGGIMMASGDQLLIQGDTALNITGNVYSYALVVDDYSKLTINDSKGTLTIEEIELMRNSEMTIHGNVDAVRANLGDGSTLSIEAVRDMQVNFVGLGATLYFIDPFAAGEQQLHNVSGDGRISLALASEGTTFLTNSSIFRGELKVREGTLLSSVAQFNSNLLTISLEGSSHLKFTDVVGNITLRTFSVESSNDGQMSLTAVGDLSESGGGNTDRATLSLTPYFYGSINLNGGLLDAISFNTHHYFLLNLNNSGIMTSDDVRVVSSIHIQSGTLDSKTTGYFRAVEDSNMIMAGTISGDATTILAKTDSGRVSLTGNMNDFLGAISVREGVLEINTNIANLASLSIWDQEKLVIASNRTVTVNNGVSSASASYIVDADGSFGIELGSRALLNDNVYLRMATSTIDITATGANGGEYRIKSFMGANGSGALSTLNIGSGAKMSITGDVTTLDSADVNAPASFMLSHLGQNNASTTINVSGLLDITAGITNRDGKGVINVQSGGTLLLRKGLYALDKGSDADAITINAKDGSTLSLFNQVNDTDANVLKVLLAGGAQVMGADTTAGVDTTYITHALQISGTDANKSVQFKLVDGLRSLNVSSVISSAAGNLSGVSTATTLGQRISFSGANTYATGSTITGEGTVIAANLAAFGTGAITLQGGTLDLDALAIKNDIYAEGGTLHDFSAHAGQLSVTGNVRSSGTFSTNTSISEGAQLQLTGTWKITDAIKNSGTLVLGDGLILDLSALSLEEGVGLNIFNNVGDGATADVSALLNDRNKLDSQFIEGFSTIGREFTLTNDGLLRYTLTSSKDLSFDGGVLDWRVGVSLIGGNFAQKDSITFTGVNGASSVALLEDIAARSIVLADNTSLNIYDDRDSSAEGRLTLTVGEIILGENAHLIVRDQNPVILLDLTAATLSAGSSMSIMSLGDADIELTSSAKLYLQDTLENKEYDFASITGGVDSVLELKSQMSVLDQATSLLLPNFRGHLELQSGAFASDIAGSVKLSSVELAAGVSYSISDTLAEVQGIAHIIGEAGSLLNLNLNDDVTVGTTLTLNESFMGDIEIKTGALSAFSTTSALDPENPIGLTNVGDLIFNDGTVLVFNHLTDIHDFMHDLRLVDGARVTVNVWGDSESSIVHEISGAIIGGADTTFVKLGRGAGKLNNIENFKGSIVLSSTSGDAGRLIIDSNANELASIRLEAGSVLDIEGDTHVVSTSTYSGGSAASMGVGEGASLVVTGTENTSFLLEGTVNIAGSLTVHSAISNLDAAGIINVQNGGTLELRQGLYSIYNEEASTINTHDGATVKLWNQTTASSQASDEVANLITNFAAGSTIIAMDEQTRILNSLETSGDGVVTIQSADDVENIYLNGVISGDAGLSIKGDSSQYFHLNAGNSYKGLTTVDRAHLILGDATALSKGVGVTLSNGASLDLTQVEGIQIGGTLRVGADSELSFRRVDGSVVINALDLSLSGDEKARLDFGADPLGLEFDIELFSGLSSITVINGINFNNEGKADAGDFFEGWKGELTYDSEDGTLSFNNYAFNDLIWKGGDGNFSDTDGWESVYGISVELSGTDKSITFEAIASVVSSTVVIGDSYSVTDMIIEGDGANYTFKLDDEEKDKLTVQKNLEVKKSAEATFKFDLVLNDDINILVDADSSLTLDGEGGFNADTLISNGSLEAEGYAITIKNATQSHGRLVAQSLNLATGKNSFSQIEVSGEIMLNDGGSLELSESSTIGGISGGGYIKLTGASSNLSIGTDVTLNTLVATVGELSTESALTIKGNVDITSLDVEGELSITGSAEVSTLFSGSTATITGAANIGTLKNTAAVRLEHVSIEGNVILSLDNGSEITSLGNLSIETVSIGGSLTVGRMQGEGVEKITSNLTVRGNASFSELIVTGDYEAENNALSVGDGSFINVLNNAASFTLTDGDATIGSLSSGATLSNLGTGVLTINDDTDVESFSNAGSVDISENLKVRADVTNGGILDIDGGVELTGENSFFSLNARGNITGAESLRVSGNSSAHKVEDGMELIIQGDTTEFNLSNTTEDVNLGRISGAGSLTSSSTGSLTLQHASSAKNLTMEGNSLSLGGSLTLKGDLGTAKDRLTLSVDYQPILSSAVLTANSIATATGLTLNMSSSYLEGLNLANGSSYELTDLEEGLEKTFLLSFADSSASGSSWEFNHRIYSLALTDKGNVSITLTFLENTWVSSTGNWDDSSDNWLGSVPKAGETASFLGDGEDTVYVNGVKEVGVMRIVGAYEFYGDSIIADSLTHTAEVATIANDLQVNGVTSISAEGIEMHLSRYEDMGSVYYGSLSTQYLEIAEGASLKIGEGSSLSVGQKATDVTKVNQIAGTILNDGMVVLYGTLQDQKYSINSITSSIGSLDIQGSADVEIGTLEQNKLIQSRDASLTITGSASVGTVTSNGRIDASGTDVSFNITGDDSVLDILSSNELVLSGENTEVSSLRVDSLKMNTQLKAGDDFKLLWANELKSLDGSSSINLTLNGQLMELGYGSYTLISSADHNLSWANITLDENIRDLVLSGKDIVYFTAGDNPEDGFSIGFTITDATERGWIVSQNYAATPGFTPGDNPDSTVNPMYRITAGGKNELIDYSKLDSVEFVHVDSDYTLELGHLADDEHGAVLRNLGGDSDKTLTLNGGSATLENSIHSELHALIINDTDVDVQSVATAGKLEIGHITLKGSAVLSVRPSISTTRAFSSSVPSNFSVTETLNLNDSSVHEVETGGVAHAAQLEAKGNSSVEVYDGGYSFYGTAALSDYATLQSRDSGIIEIGDLTASAETNTTQGHIILGQGDYKGGYSASTTFETSAGGKTSFTTSSMLHVVGNEGSQITLVDRKNDNSVASINTVGSTIMVGTNGLLINDGEMVDSALVFKVDTVDLIDQMRKGTMIDLLAENSQLKLSGTQIIIGQTDESVVSLDFSGIDTTGSYTLFDINVAGLEEVDVKFTGTALSKFFNDLTINGDQLIVNFNQEHYVSKVSSHNGIVGAKMLSPYFFSPQTGDLASVLAAMETAIGEDADKLAAAVAGASVTSLGGSMLSSVDRQLQNMRNRSMAAGAKIMSDSEAPIYRSWISAEGGFSKLDADGTAAGYDYSSFGGSFGVDVALSSQVTLGAAFTTLYGSVDSSGVDSATGDLNTYNISTFARVTHGHWSHSFVATVSLAESSLERTVNYGNGSYKNDGDTDGLGFGFMYEVGYSYALDEESRMMLQPVFNVSLVHASIGAYSEEGSNVSLDVGEQEGTYATFGIGTRFDAVMGESILNRRVLFNSHAMLKIDAGERYTEANVNIIGQSTSGRIKGSEAGVFGVELGAGLNIPIKGENDALFINAGVDLRSGQSNMNANVGYRFSF